MRHLEEGFAKARHDLLVVEDDSVDVLGLDGITCCMDRGVGSSPSLSMHLLEKLGASAWDASSSRQLLDALPTLEPSVVDVAHVGLRAIIESQELDNRLDDLEAKSSQPRRQQRKVAIMCVGVD